MNIGNFIVGSLLLLAPLVCSCAPAQSKSHQPKGIRAKAEGVPVLPAPTSLIYLRLVPDANAISGHGAKLDDNKFKYLLSKAKLLSPAEAKKIRTEFQYAPYYRGTFATKQGTYAFALFLAGLGSITAPHHTQRWFTFEQPAKN